MPSTLTIECKMFGRPRQLSPDWSIPLPPEWKAPGEPLTLRGLISRVVREEVASFRDRQEQRRLLQVLTPSEIERGAAKGKIALGGSDLDQPVDVEAAIAAALQAFEDGLYFVFIDDNQKESLDTTVSLKEDSRITFLRLVALVGG